MTRFTSLGLALATALSLMWPTASFARDAGVVRHDGSIQQVFTLRGHFLFVNKYSRRHLRTVLQTQTIKMISEKDII